MISGSDARLQWRCRLFAIVHISDIGHAESTQIFSERTAVKSGDVNALDCDKPMKGQFTVTPLVAPGVPGVPLTFQCTKGK